MYFKDISFFLNDKQAIQTSCTNNQTCNTAVHKELWDVAIQVIWLNSLTKDIEVK